MTASTNRYWVIGAEYLDTTFTRVVAGTTKILGPFLCKSEAHRVWSGLAHATKSHCKTRY